MHRVGVVSAANPPREDPAREAGGGHDRGDHDDRAEYREHRVIVRTEEHRDDRRECRERALRRVAQLVDESFGACAAADGVRHEERDPGDGSDRPEDFGDGGWSAEGGGGHRPEVCESGKAERYREGIERDTGGRRRHVGNANALFLIEPLVCKLAACNAMRTFKRPRRWLVSFCSANRSPSTLPTQRSSPTRRRSTSSQATRRRHSGRCSHPACPTAHHSLPPTTLSGSGGRCARSSSRASRAHRTSRGRYST